MTKKDNVISIRQRMIDRIFAEEDLLKNLSYHYGVDVDTVKTWLVESYSEDMLRSLIASLDRLEKAKEDAEEKIRRGEFI